MPNATPDFTKVAKGLASKQTDDSVYIVPTSMLSVDDDGVMRCGQLSMFSPHGSRWIGSTVSQLFKQSWKPDSTSGPNSGDPNEPIIGKVAYHCKWQGTTKADITTDKNVAQPGERIGAVIGQQGHMAYILMDESFVTSPRFKDEGFWAKTM